MHKFEYDIRLNDLGAPYIHLPEKIENKTEDKFMFLEMSRMIVIGVLKNVEQKKIAGKRTITDHNATKLVEAYNTITMLADEVGLLFKAQKEIEDELGDFLTKNDEE